MAPEINREALIHNIRSSPSSQTLEHNTRLDVINFQEPELLRTYLDTMEELLQQEDVRGDSAPRERLNVISDLNQDGGDYMFFSSTDITAATQNQKSRKEILYKLGSEIMIIAKNWGAGYKSLPLSIKAAIDGFIHPEITTIDNSLVITMLDAIQSHELRPFKGLRKSTKTRKEKGREYREIYIDRNSL